MTVSYSDDCLNFGMEKYIDLYRYCAGRGIKKSNVLKFASRS
jgi:hypothetical protein